ncbi:MAG: hypothetical protein HYT40_04005 [Candidatus Sungbacteria bacterium]|uniref:HD/PDEase domain-containing protein n=1 Tax=Candidatus Sungiibacteriota bacterium TaxID=2750080 RepID=A0A931SC95_9BACT|nr:hypothetical protein [Candidatus Sungbacteria bacterium]
MTVRIKAAQLPAANDCLQVEDIIYLPQKLSFAQFKKLNACLGKANWFKKLVETKAQEGRSLPMPELPILWLEQLYEHERVTADREPEWIRQASPLCKRHLRREYVFGDGVDPLAIVPSIPFTGIGYAVLEDGLIEETTNAFGLFRLARVRQLGFLHDPVVRSGELESIGMLFSHTRWLHVLDVTAIATLIALNNELRDEGLYHLQVAAISHDALTPAGGDTTKQIDPQAFDEERNFPQLFSLEGWPALSQKYGLQERKLTEIVQGKSTLGKILDLADKIAYVARDAREYYGRYDPSGPVGYPDEYFEIKKLVETRALICGIWDAVEIEDGEAVIADGERLTDFLRLRALLFKNLYHHPASRFLEHTIANVITQYLYDSDELTKQELLQFGDADLERLIGEVVGDDSLLLVGVNFMRPRVETFKDAKEARRREAKLIRNGMFTLLENWRGTANPGMNFLVRKNKQVAPFREAYPKAAREIEKLIAPEKPLILYYFPIAEMPLKEKFLKAFMAYRKRKLRKGGSFTKKSPR